MKKIFLTLFLSVSVVSGAQTNTETVKSFFGEIVSFQNVDVNEHNPIITLDELATEQADTTLALTGDNVSKTFDKAMEYTNAIIVVENHTAVLVKDWENCRQSGAWGVCMPYGEGYVKRAALVNLQDYINNIIGIPDGQERKVYLFN
ncbi:cupredoxin domain-containing protein [Marinilabilia rubra]|uniref:Uncharacterized protein n=1 Tax=Marinilabilia rubra TaxID=2162893 RepID=A0A2U2BAL6_9BACT|nr:hypothetical protein [Marinilabilia rubra]PWE00111.1 hypothetical protein DDZ16_07065 [Marinilabilia rubra]